MNLKHKQFYTPFVSTNFSLLSYRFTPLVSIKVRHLDTFSPSKSPYPISLNCGRPCKTLWISFFCSFYQQRTWKTQGTLKPSPFPLSCPAAKGMKFLHLFLSSINSCSTQQNLGMNQPAVGYLRDEIIFWNKQKQSLGNRNEREMAYEGLLMVQNLWRRKEFAFSCFTASAMDCEILWIVELSTMRLWIRPRDRKYVVAS